MILCNRKSSIDTGCFTFYHILEESRHKSSLSIESIKILCSSLVGNKFSNKVEEDEDNE